MLLIISSTAVILALLAVGYGYWRHIRLQKVISPFDAGTLASLSFTAYYPTYLPPGYSIGRSSASEPQAGVVVFHALGAKGQKIYVSEEARPQTFDFGGYYNNFTNLREKTTDNGTIAAGYISGHTLVGSLAINDTWVLLTTSAPITPDQFIAVLSSLVVGH